MNKSERNGEENVTKRDRLYNAGYAAGTLLGAAIVFPLCIMVVITGALCAIVMQPFALAALICGEPRLAGRISRRGLSLLRTGAHFAYNLTHKVRLQAEEAGIDTGLSQE